MLTGMTEDDWAIALAVFDAAQSRSGQPGHDEALLHGSVGGVAGWSAVGGLLFV